MQRCSQKFVSAVALCVFIEQKSYQLGVSLLYSIVKTWFGLSWVCLIQNLLSSRIWTSQELNKAFNITSLAKVKESSGFTLSLGGNWCLCFPFEIKIALLKSFHYFELVTGDPIFFRIFFEIKCEVSVDHRAGQLFSRKRCKPFFHELEDYVFVGVISRLNFLPWYDWCHRCLSLNFGALGGFLRRFFIYILVHLFDRIINFIAGFSTNFTGRRL